MSEFAWNTRKDRFDTEIDKESKVTRINRYEKKIVLHLIWSKGLKIKSLKDDKEI